MLVSFDHKVFKVSHLIPLKTQIKNFVVHIHEPYRTLFLLEFVWIYKLVASFFSHVVFRLFLYMGVCTNLKIY